MEIRFISSLTAEDENQVAPAVLKAVGALLDQLPIAYTLRIETSGAQIYQHTHTSDAPDEGARSIVEEAHSRFPPVVHPFMWGDRNES